MIFLCHAFNWHKKPSEYLKLIKFASFEMVPHAYLSLLKQIIADMVLISLFPIQKFYM